MSTEPDTAYIAEDEPLARDALLAMFAALPEWRVQGSAGDGRQALQDCLRETPDVLFTDIRMPLLNGLELAVALRAEHPGLHVVFITAYDQHAVEAFRVAAVDYLLKPVTDKEFRACLARVQESLRRQRTMQQLAASGVPLAALLRQQRQHLQHLVVRSIGRVDIVPLNDVIAFRAAGNYMDVVTAARTFVHRETIKSLVERLDPARFVQVHRSAIVAIGHMRRLQRQAAGPKVMLSDDSAVPVGARHLADVQRVLGL